MTSKETIKALQRQVGTLPPPSGPRAELAKALADLADLAARRDDLHAAFADESTKTGEQAPSRLRESLADGVAKRVTRRESAIIRADEIDAEAANR